MVSGEVVSRGVQMDVYVLLTAIWCALRTLVDFSYFMIKESRPEPSAFIGFLDFVFVAVFGCVGFYLYLTDV